MMETLLSIFSPRKRAPDQPKPLPHPQPRGRTYSRKDRVRARRALGRISDSGTRSPRNRISNASSITATHDTSGEISFLSQPEEQDATAEMETPASETGSPAKRDVRSSPLLGSSPAPKARGVRQIRQQRVHAYLKDSDENSDENSDEDPDEDMTDVHEDVQDDSEEQDDKKGGQQEDEEEEEEEEDDDDEEYSFNAILNHRWVKNKIQLRIDWEEHAQSWEPEETFHRDAPATLFAYWRSKGGRPDNPKRPGVYDIFAIRNHSKNRKKLLVEWVGYEKKEQTWEDRESIERSCKLVVDNYFAGLNKGKKKKKSKK